MLRVASLLLIAIISCVELDAQIAASPYSAYGIGVLKDRTSSMNRSMGGSGIALRDPISLNNINPAAYNSIQGATQMTEVGIFFESDRYHSTSEAAKYSTASMTNMNFWLRFTSKWAGAVGMSPYSTVNYGIESGRGIGNNSSLIYLGNGGVTQFYFGNSYMITKHLSLGITASFLHGSIDRKETITSGLAIGTQVSNYTYINQGMFDYGLQYQFFLGDTHSLTVGAVYNNRIHLNTTQETTIYQQQDTLTSSTKNVADYLLPEKFGGGIAFSGTQSTFTADLSFLEWSKARLEDGLKLRNTHRMSLGYQFRGSNKGESFWSGFIFRAGYYQQENAMILQKTTFTDWGASMGIGIPVSNKRNTLYLTYSYNHTGTLDKNLIQQQSQIISLDLTFRDLWGIKRKFD